MPITVTHSKVSSVPDGGDASLVRPSDWNADHVVSDLPLASGDLIFYVSTTGDDDNDGLTVGTPLATGARALYLIAQYDFEWTYDATIQFADGTYTEPRLRCAGNFTRLDTIRILGNLTTPANCVRTNSGFACSGQEMTWVIGGFKFNGSGGQYSAAEIYGVGNLVIDDIIFNPPSTSRTCTFAYGGSTVYFGWNDNKIWIEGPFESLVKVEQGVMVQMSNLTLTFSAAVSCYVLFQLTRWCGITVDNLTVVNPSNLTGKSYDLQLYSWYLGNILPSALPGSGPNTFTTANDMTCSLESFGGTYKNNFLVQKQAGAAAAANLLPDTWAIIKESGSGDVNLVYNDAGTLKKVALT